MSILQLRTLGDPVLLSKAEKVINFDDIKLKHLIKSMMITMKYFNGVGLAAPQIGTSLQIFTYNVRGNSGYIINPKIEVSKETQERAEGCLSIPDISGFATRPKYAKVIGYDIKQRDIMIDGEGLMARVLEHETDHLNGKFFISKLKKEKYKEIMQELRLRF